MSPRITGSVVGRVMACPASAVLPAVHETSDAAERGTARHAYLAAIPKVGREAALAAVPEEHREECSCIVLDGLPLGQEYVQEVAFAYDPVTDEGWTVGYDIGRAYPDIPGAIFGSADVVGVFTGHVEIADYKGDFDDSLNRAEANPQIKTLALAACREYALDTAKVELIHLRPDGTHWIDAAEYDAFTLDAHAGALREMVKRVSAAAEVVAHGHMPNVSPGEHCRWCPAYRSCPANIAVSQQIATLSDDPAALATRLFGAITPETAAKALLTVRQLERIVKTAKDELRRLADLEPLVLPNGKVYGAVERERLDPGVVLDVALALYGEDFARSAGTWECSKESVKKALRSVSKEQGVPLAGLVRDFMAEVRTKGGVSVTREVREHAAGEVSE